MVAKEEHASNEDNIIPLRMSEIYCMQSQGWQCPVCKRVYAPSVKECDRCNDNYESVAGIKPKITIYKQDGTGGTISPTILPYVIESENNQC